MMSRAVCGALDKPRPETDMLKSLSISAYFGMVAGLLALAATKNLFSPSLFVIAPQVAALFVDGLGTYDIRRTEFSCGR
jgi:hypothetical protein